MLDAEFSEDAETLWNEIPKVLDRLSQYDEMIKQPGRMNTFMAIVCRQEMQTLQVRCVQFERGLRLHKEVGVEIRRSSSATSIWNALLRLSRMCPS